MSDDEVLDRPGPANFFFEDRRGAPLMDDEEAVPSLENGSPASPVNSSLGAAPQSSPMSIPLSRPSSPKEQQNSVNSGD